MNERMDERIDERMDERVDGAPGDAGRTVAHDGPPGHVVVVPFGRRRVTAAAEPVVEVDAETRLRHPSAGGRPSMRIDCGECVMEGTDACADCVVSFVVGRQPGDALVVDAEEARAQRILAEAGLLPALRHRRRASGD
ncbi:MAG: hypothetical protein ACKO72_01180 [Actinomycetes bacterium]